MNVSEHLLKEDMDLLRCDYSERISVIGNEVASIIVLWERHHHGNSVVTTWMINRSSLPCRSLRICYPLNLNKWNKIYLWINVEYAKNKWRIPAKWKNPISRSLLNRIPKSSGSAISTFPEPVFAYYSKFVFVGVLFCCYVLVSNNTNGTCILV